MSVATGNSVWPIATSVAAHARGGRPAPAPAEGNFGACLRDARTIGSHIAVGGHRLEVAAQLRFGLLENSLAV
jgi:hypothetical protein